MTMMSEAFGVDMRLDLTIQGLRATCVHFVSEQAADLKARVERAVAAEASALDLDALVAREVRAMLGPMVRAEVKRSIEWRAHEQMKVFLDHVDLEAAVRDAIRRESGA